VLHLLPDYPHTKRLLDEAFHERTSAALKRQLGIFSQMKRSQLHEGARCALTRDDGSSEVIEMKHLRASAEAEYDVREIDKLDPDKITHILDTLGKRMASEQVKLFFQRVDEAVNEVGNVADSSKPFIEQFLEMMEKADMGFEPDGTPSPRQLVVGSPEAARRASDQMREIEADPTLKRRYTDIVECKRQEWRDREAARNLVE